MIKTRSFTLIELLVVISIISLLASVVLASLNSAREKGRLGSAKYFSTQVDHVAGDQAVGIWDFDECSGSVAMDRSGFGAQGTLTNMVLPAAWSSDSPIGAGCSLSFDGTDDYINASDSTMPLGNSPKSISAWFKINSLPGLTVCKVIVNYGVASNNSAQGVALCNLGGVMNIRYYGWANDMDSPASIQAGVWNHAAVTFDGTTASTYLNGSIIGSSNRSTWNTVSSSLKIGGIINLTAGYYFNGQIDAVHIFAKTLTASDIGSIYAFEAKTKKFAQNQALR